MIRKSIVLFCDNEHGTGARTFPNLDEMTTDAIQQALIADLKPGELRRAAKKNGWGRINGADYCPDCMEAM